MSVEILIRLDTISIDGGENDSTEVNLGDEGDESLNIISTNVIENDSAVINVRQWERVEPSSCHAKGLSTEIYPKCKFSMAECYFNQYG